MFSRSTKNQTEATDNQNAQPDEYDGCLDYARDDDDYRFALLVADYLALYRHVVTNDFLNAVSAADYSVGHAADLDRLVHDDAELSSAASVATAFMHVANCADDYAADYALDYYDRDGNFVD
ncbi:unnamed protein product [Rotaria socialis]|uniref:Uncharacterized protein n=1 Tax=Rotaria socialis TaxID=392032 RepID=A0A817ZUU7_9BILA|nr:unnamed protein product [Rotaria socialis]CAF3427445.1 unnamed protein product [Rotaria socialis]CAF3543492.1 unnamed protein product [Rotaria socialis]CAF3549425.1 unnamed protein product [Rotaria socialis]CAF3586692.1 unnamed protein product [Rotaria socialis]